MAHQLTEEFYINTDTVQKIEVINVFVQVHQEPQVEHDENITEKKELSMEEKRRLFYSQRLENINRILKWN